MVPIEWYRNFVAVYRAGSVSRAARERGISQPAMSQSLAALETTLGAPLFERMSRGMRPTARGEALYAQVFDPLDRLEGVTRSFLPRAGGRTTFRLGASPEWLHEFALPRLAPLGLAFAVTLGTDRELLTAVESGDLDAAAVQAVPGRALQHRPLAEQRFVLIAPASLEIPANLDLLGPTGDVASRLNALSWVSYSEERPTTRRFFAQHLGARFAADPRLVVPDLRSVVRAVELGMGVGIVPHFAAARSLADGRVHEPFPLDLPGARWNLAYRAVDADRDEMRALASALR